MKEKKKDVSSGFPGWRESLCGVYACLCVCSRPCSHTPGSFTLTATGNLTEGGRCLNIHQPSSKCSVWARCDGPEAGTELPKQLFIFPNVFIFSSSTQSPLVSTYNRGLAVPAYPPPSSQVWESRWQTEEREVAFGVFWRFPHWFENEEGNENRNCWKVQMWNIPSTYFCPTSLMISGPALSVKGWVTVSDSLLFSWNFFSGVCRHSKSQSCLQVTQKINSIVLWSAVQMKLKLPWLSLAKEVKVHFM